MLLLNLTILFMQPEIETVNQSWYDSTQTVGGLFTHGIKCVCQKQMVCDIKMLPNPLAHPIIVEGSPCYMKPFFQQFTNL